MSVIHSEDNILRYLKFVKKTIQEGLKFNCSIRPVAPNLSKDMSESLGCHLISKGKILTQLKPIKSVERYVNKDILVNGYHKLEVKATSSGEGTITPSASNYEAFAWMWFDFESYFYDEQMVVPLHLLTNPKQCITADRYVKTLKQNKLTIKSAINQAKETNNYTLYKLDLAKMQLRLEKDEELSSQFFGVEIEG